MLVVVCTRLVCQPTARPALNQRMRAAWVPYPNIPKPISELRRDARALERRVKGVVRNKGGGDDGGDEPRVLQKKSTQQDQPPKRDRERDKGKERELQQA